MKLNDLGNVVREYEGIFYNALRESGKNKLLLDDHIFMSKQYINTLDVDTDTNIELQKYFAKHVEGMYCSIIEPEKLLAQVLVHENNTYFAKLIGKFSLVINPLAVGGTVYALTESIPAALISSAYIFTTLYIAERISSKDSSMKLSKIPGTPEYKNKLFSDLEDKLIDMGKLTVD